MKVQSRIEVQSSVTGLLSHVKALSLKSEELNRVFAMSSESSGGSSVFMPEPFKARAPGAFWRKESKGRKRCAVVGCWERGLS